MNLLRSRKLLVPAIILVLIMGLSVFLGSCGSTVTQTTTATSTATTTSMAVTTTTATATTTVKPITLVFTSHNSGSGFWRMNVIDPYFRELEKRTNGRIVVEEHWNGELVSLKDAYDYMLKGSVDLAEYFPSMLTGRFPMDDVVAFAPTDTLCYRSGRVMYELGQQFPQMLKPYSDAKLLWREPSGSMGAVTVKKAIRDFAGSKGIKMGPVGQWSSNLISAFGWTPESVPPEDSTTALQTGVQDGSGISLYLLWEFGWGPIVHYLTYPLNFDNMEVNCSLNMDTWNKLPKDIQDTINSMQDWIIDLQDKAVMTNFRDMLPKATSDFGIEIIKLPDAEQAKFAAAAAPVQDAFVKSLNDQGLPGTDLMNKFLELNKKYSGQQYAP